MEFVTEFEFADSVIQGEKDGLRRRVLSEVNQRILCECNGTKIDLLRCLQTCSSFGIRKESPIIFDSDTLETRIGFVKSVITCSDCVRSGMERIMEYFSEKI